MDAGPTPTARIGAPDILLVEDSPTLADLFVFALQANKSCATIQIVHDGAAVLDLLLGEKNRAECALPRVLLLDLHIPRMDGLEVLERLRADERTRLLPVLIYSASDRESDRSDALRQGANAYVRKPVGFKDACAVIARIEHDWLQPGAANP